MKQPPPCRPTFRDKRELMPYSEATFQTDDRLTLYQRGWLPQRECRAIVVLVHGLNEHCGRYEELALELNRQGWAVWTFDLRGHGRSDGPRVFISSMDQHQADVAAFLDRVVPRETGQPLFLLGHSMGGLIVGGLAIAGRSDVRGYILSAPAFAVRDNVFPLLRRLAPLVGRWFPRLRLVKLSPRRLSSDPRVVAEFQSDPLVFHGRLPARTAAEILRAGQSVMSRADQITAPLLVLHGTDDRTADLEASRRFCDRVGPNQATLKVYEGAYHDLPREPMRKQVMADVVEWIAARIGSHERKDQSP